MKLNDKRTTKKLKKNKGLQSFKESVLQDIRKNIDFLMALSYKDGKIAGIDRAEEVIKGK